MTLDPGARVGAFSITGPIGAGGMGGVYRARDSRLQRDGDDVLAVDVTPGVVPSFLLSRTLFKGLFLSTGLSWSTWDVMPDGQGCLLIHNFGQPQTGLSLVQHWIEELRHE